MKLTRPLISAPALRALLDAGQPVVLLDCGFDLTDAAAGERAYAAGHLPGALYAHLDRDLSGDKSAGPAKGGRHPLPPREAFAATAGRWGVRPGVAVVAYDAQGGPYAARAWWLLRWLGHAEVAVLDEKQAQLAAEKAQVMDWHRDGFPLWCKLVLLSGDSSACRPCGVACARGGEGRAGGRLACGARAEGAARERALPHY